MLELDLPGRGRLELRHLVMDVNGTLALDGQLLEGVQTRLSSLRHDLELHFLTTDTHGRQAEIDRQLGLTAIRIRGAGEAAQKARYVRSLGARTVAAIGQGANDREMLKVAALGICILSIEGTAVETLLAADLVTPDIFSALDLLEHPARILASLRK